MRKLFDVCRHGVGADFDNREVSMSLIETWEARTRDPMTSVEERQQVTRCIDDLEDATTPRAPRPEWFEQWDAWWFKDIGVLLDVEYDRNGISGGTRESWIYGTWDDGARVGFPADRCTACIPVRRPPDPPAMDVGWGVVGGVRC